MVFYLLFFLTPIHHDCLDLEPNSLNEPVWDFQKSGVTASLRGLCVVDKKVVWASGSEGTVITTNDQGITWKNVSVKQAPECDFRDIHAFDQRRAVVLSAGQPARIYLTDDGGRSWQKKFEHEDKSSFFDAISFMDSMYGIAMSDPLDDRILLIETRNGGQTWTELPTDRRPEAAKGEAGFAASGTNMAIAGERILIALGGAPKGEKKLQSRIVYSDDRGITWNTGYAKIPRNESSGIFSLHFANKKIGVAVGGNYLKPAQDSGNLAITHNGGTTWDVPSGSRPSGYRSGVAHFRSNDRIVFVCVGTNGTDMSTDQGNTWKKVSEIGFHAIAFERKGSSGWAVGGDGKVARWRTQK